MKQPVKIQSNMFDIICTIEQLSEFLNISIEFNFLKHSAVWPQLFIRNKGGQN